MKKKTRVIIELAAVQNGLQTTLNYSLKQTMVCGD